MINDEEKENFQGRANNINVVEKDKYKGSDDQREKVFFLYKSRIYKEKAQNKVAKFRRRNRGKQQFRKERCIFPKTGVTVRRHGPDVERGRRYSPSTLAAISAAENNQLYK